MIELDCSGNSICHFRSPQKDMELNLDGSKNFIIRARIKRTSGNNWRGVVRWSGSWIQGIDNVDQNGTTFYYSDEHNTREKQIPEPANLDNEYVIVEWDMRDVNRWQKSIIHQIYIQFEGASASTYHIDWVEIGGKVPVKYQDGQLKFPLRSNESAKRIKGTWAKIKYRAKTTDKFNIFAILAKYRETF